MHKNNEFIQITAIFIKLHNVFVALPYCNKLLKYVSVKRHRNAKVDI